MSSMNLLPSARLVVEKIEEREQQEADDEEEEEEDVSGEIHFLVRVSVASILSNKRDSEKLWYGRGFVLLPRVEDGLNRSIILFSCFFFLRFCVNSKECEEMVFGV